MDQNIQIIALSHLSHTCKCFAILYFLPICCVNSLIINNANRSEWGQIRSVMTHWVQGHDPFNQNFWKFQSKTQWISSVQPEKFYKNKMWTTFFGQTTVWSKNDHSIQPFWLILIPSASRFSTSWVSLPSCYGEEGVFSVLISCFVYPMMVI